ncbi:uncharacterized protein PG998_011671 [Apiospora kogelbergensis]|uniref:uncharacterized protein n=1 Tax=Apiospora kogelbergensis TaxID=1337665 RepID=UPI0031327020
MPKDRRDLSPVVPAQRSVRRVYADICPGELFTWIVEPDKWTPRTILALSGEQKDHTRSLI